MGVEVSPGAYGFTGFSAEKNWKNVTYLYSRLNATFGVTKDGKVLISNWTYSWDIFSWENLVKVMMPATTCVVGLKRDGTLYFEGSTLGTLTKVMAEGLTNIKDIAGGFDHLLILYNTGQVVGYGNNTSGQLNVGAWPHSIQKISAGYRTSLGLNIDGTVRYIGVTTNSQHLVTGWTDIVEISAGRYHNLGLKSDGTMVGAGSTSYFQQNTLGIKLPTWQPIKKVSLQLDKAAYNLFNWDPPEDIIPSEYEIQIATDIEYQNIVETAVLSDNFYEAVTLDPSLDYHWRVRYR